MVVRIKERIFYKYHLAFYWVGNICIPLDIVLQQVFFVQEPIFDVVKKFGHSSIKATGNYLHVIENDLHQAIENPKIDDLVKSGVNSNSLTLDKNLTVVNSGPGGEQLISKKRNLQDISILIYS